MRGERGGEVANGSLSWSVGITLSRTLRDVENETDTAGSFSSRAGLSVPHAPESQALPLAVSFFRPSRGKQHLSDVKVSVRFTALVAEPPRLCPTRIGWRSTWVLHCFVLEAEHIADYKNATQVGIGTDLNMAGECNSVDLIPPW